MCGFFGAYSRDGKKLSFDQAATNASLAALGHRGPDGAHINAEPNLVIGHTRLAMVDLAPRSDQPFSDPSNRYSLIFNGEIYNFKTLRTELERNGQSFVTDSDTEVVLYSLIHSDNLAKTLSTFEGMFALAFIDRQTGTMLLARDRFGMKPLHYTETGDVLYFASEINALKSLIDLRPDRLTIASYLLGHGGPMRGPSFYEGVVTLEPGCMILAQAGAPLSEQPFFKLTDFLDADRFDQLNNMTPKQIVDLVEEGLWNGVESHLFADAQVGAFCSGGVDSSLLVAMAARQKRDVQLFHANVRGVWSEYKAAKALADHLNLPLHVVDFEETDFIDLMPEVAYHYGHPFSYHPNCPPMMAVARLARDTGVKGLLSGEGSDELFLGYPWLGRRKLTSRWDKLRQGMGRTVRKIPEFGQILLPDHFRTVPEVRDILSCLEAREDNANIAEHCGTAPFNKDETLGWTQEYMHHHLRTLLHRNDTMGMSGSIEARFPFLDNNLVALAANLPGRFKLRKSPFVFEKAHPFVRDKWAVREVADRYMPPNLSKRKKLGFWTTVFKRISIQSNYFHNSPLSDILRLSDRQLTEFADTASDDTKLRLLHLDVWHRACISGEEHGHQKERLRRAITIRSE